MQTTLLLQKLQNLQGNLSPFRDSSTSTIARQVAAPVSGRLWFIASGVVSASAAATVDFLSGTENTGATVNPGFKVRLASAGSFSFQGPIPFDLSSGIYVRLSSGTTPPEIHLGLSSLS